MQQVSITDFTKLIVMFFLMIFLLLKICKTFFHHFSWRGLNVEDITKQGGKINKLYLFQQLYKHKVKWVF